MRASCQVATVQAPLSLELANHLSARIHRKKWLQAPEDKGASLLPLRMRHPQLPLLLNQRLIKRQSLRADFPRRRGGDDGAAGFVDVAAVVEFAGADVGAEFGHGVGDVVVDQVHQAERLQAGRIDDGGVFVETVHAGVGGGVLARIERFGDVAFFCDVTHHQIVHGA